MSSREQEPYSYDNETVDILRSVIELRYALVHYIYSEYMKAVINKDMYFKPLCFEYEDEVSKRIENQLLVGDSLMVTPIYEENSVGRYVYLPEDMLLWKAADYNNRVYEVMKKGHHYINVDFKEVPIFIRKNKIIVLGKHSRNVETLNTAQLNVIAFVEDKANYVYYDDDGTSMDYKKGKYNMVSIYIEKQDEDYLINVDNTGNTKVNILHFEIVDINGKIHKKTINI
jgi:alpha-glucosidase